LPRNLWVDPYASASLALLQDPARARAAAVEKIGEAQARAAEIAGQATAAAQLQGGNAQAAAQQQGGQIWGNAIQSIGHTPELVMQLQAQSRAAQMQKLQQANLVSEIQDRNAQAQQRIAGQKANQAVDTIMAQSLKQDPQTGVYTFDRPTFEQGLIQGGNGHLYPSLAETLDKLDASAAKRNAEARGMFAETLIGIEKAGFTPESVMAGAAYLKANQVATNEHIQPVLDAIAADPSPENIKGIVTRLGTALPEYGARKDAEEKRLAELAKTKGEAAKFAGEGAVSAAEAQNLATFGRKEAPDPAQAALHAAQLAEINAKLTGTMPLSPKDRAELEIQRAKLANEEAAPQLTGDALKMTAKQYAMTGQLPPMGMGKTGAAVRTSIINEAANQYKNLDLPSQIAAYNANKTSLSTLQRTTDKVSAFEATAGKNLDQFLSLADKIPDTGVPWVNAPIRSLDAKLLGSADMAAASAARDVALREIARVTNDPNLSGVLSDSARREVSSLSPADATFAQIKAVAKVLKQDMANVHSSLNEQLTDIQKRIATPPAGAAPAPKILRYNPATGKVE
jgi:hypothetical protein